FKPDAALEAAQWVDKVRINPGNFADKKKFAVREYTDDQYDEELVRIEETFKPLLDICKQRGIAMRIGTNHGSLSDRIMNRYGDTPLGMVESALEFARISRKYDYHNFVFSMKSSNPKVMIAAYRLLVARLDALDDEAMRNAKCEIANEATSIPHSPFRIPNSPWNYPIHLGVTEAGDGEDGRIKSAIGIGSLLHDGIGDTIRVSLTEDSIHEIPVARALIAQCEMRNAKCEISHSEFRISNSPFEYSRRPTETILAGDVAVGGEETMRVVVRQKTFDQLAHKLDKLGDFQPEIVLEQADVLEIDPRDTDSIHATNALPDAALVTIPDACDLDVISAYRLLASRLDSRHPILLKDTFGGMRNAKCEIGNENSAFPISNSEFLSSLLTAATNIGALLCDGIGDAVLIQGEEAPGQSLRLAYNTLQAAGARIFKTDYVACPSCGRTLFNLQSTTARIKAVTAHLKGVRLAIMGCIVNGPGEMADADFGYVGGAPGKVNLYVGKQPVKFNIPETEAVDRLIDLIREHGKWVDAPQPVPG
ncbi:MAG: flavodoxin-dependent (E)-4-hydroxy-3-methylbut-2-enyl-diphosphate synthase, partial [Chthoniobacterales bacterium]